MSKRKVYETISPKQFEIEVIEDRITIQELVDKFYRIHCNQPTAYWGRKKPKLESVPPICFSLQEDSQYNIKAEKYWIAIFRGGYAVEIRRNQVDHEGPHTAKLWFKSFTNHENHWIATLQIVAFFYNEEQMKAELMKCIDEGEWYVNPAEAKRSLVP